MSTIILVMSVHFAAGAAGVYLTIRKNSYQNRSENWIKYFGYLAIFVIVISSILAGRQFFLGLSLLIFSAGLLEMLRLTKRPCIFGSAKKVLALSIFIYLLLAILFSLFIFLPLYYVTFTYVLVVVFDGASQIAGKYFGKRKIVPAISPGKTLEGFGGGMLSAVLTGLILHNYVNLPVIHSFTASLLICCTAFCGDIAASAFKRAFDAKDYSRILPGQGGVLDRFDSFIFSGAFMGLYGYFHFSLPEIDNNLAVYLGYSIGFIIVLVAAEGIHYLFSLKPEYTRIILHVATGLMCISMAKLFTSAIYVVLICLQSAAFVFFSKKFKVFEGLNGVSRKTYGGVYFFLGVLLAYAVSGSGRNIAFFTLPVLIMSVCDPLAFLAGMSFGNGSCNRFGKTLAGSAAFFISAVVLLFAGLFIYENMNSAEALIIAFSLALLSAAAEYFSGYGLDNITVPAVLSLSLALTFGIF